ncbi:nuclear transport factor 2 family protein [Mycobacterium sp.]|uniref:nuclear transport factor 2 family protein n=1 Tax=Mycobacterium sp. TaxID=1785 RepID=UPI002C528B14|nr:nuclear transport factor 2 family protein [Mycobacterium sp.]HME48321.1 nuclear transport factor 2 family protein [Mycobacterium sp.]
MPSADDYANTVNRYLELLAKGSADEITALYTEDATIEDPVGSELRRGRAAVHEFYAAIENVDKETELVALKVAGNEAAFLWRLMVNAGDTRSRIEPISLMKFDDDAKITAMRALWSPADMTAL